MPLFGNKFSPKKTPPRRAQSLSNLNLEANKEDFNVDFGQVKIKLGGNEVIFDNGQWIQDSGASGASHREVMKVRKQNQHLSEENNLLKLKIEILLDMLSETTAEVSLQENDITELKKAFKANRKR